MKALQYYKLISLLLFCTLLFTMWGLVKRTEQYHKKQEVIISQNARIEFYERQPLCACAKLEYEYRLLTKRVKPKKAK